MRVARCEECRLAIVLRRESLFLLRCRNPCSSASIRVNISVSLPLSPLSCVASARNTGQQRTVADGSAQNGHEFAQNDYTALVRQSLRLEGCTVRREVGS